MCLCTKYTKAPSNLISPVSKCAMPLKSNAVSSSMALWWSSFHTHSYRTNWCFFCTKAPPVCHLSLPKLSRSTSCSRTTSSSKVKKHRTQDSVSALNNKRKLLLARKMLPPAAVTYKVFRIQKVEFKKVIILFILLINPFLL